MFLPVVLTGTYNDELVARDSDGTLRRAFEVIDEGKNGVIDSEKMKQLLKSHGEPMDDEEIQEMINAAEDPDTHTILIEDYVAMLATDN